MEGIIEVGIVVDSNLEKNTTVGNKVKARLTGGSITVEAAFVMPIIILTIFALIYLTFYLHDICRIQGVVDLTVHKAGLALKHDADVETGEISYEEINERGVFYQLFGDSGAEDEIRGILLKELSKGLFLVKAESIEVKDDKQKVRISVITDTELTLLGLTHIFQAFPKKTITGEYPVHNPAETVRCTEIILETGSKLKGVDELRNKLNSFIKSKE